MSLSESSSVSEPSLALEPVSAWSSRPVSRWLAVALIVFAGLIAYHNTFSVPFLFDDDSSIKNNPTIGSWWRAWWPPTDKGLTVSGRPVLNFTLAVNHALSGEAVWSYHALNLVIHLGAALALWSVVRQTLTLPRLAPRFAQHADGLALVIALLWTVHPLQTESVTYIVQRAESLVGLLYLLTLAGFIRAAQPGASAWWKVGTVLCCLLGMGAKEVMASAPVMILLYDRLFITGSWRETFRQRGRLHLSLCGTWVLLLALLLASGNRGGTAGFGSASSVDYGLMQFGAIAHYLRLAGWPHPLVFDYGKSIRTDLAWVLPGALVVVPLVGLSIRATWRGQPAGFCGLFFFAVLAPTSSVVPVVTQTMAEHRMYLPLAAVIAVAVVACHHLLARRSWVVFAIVALVLTMTTIRRNADYRTERSIWADAASKQPTNIRARLALGLNLVRDPARQTEAMAEYQAILQLNPDDVESHVALGNLYFSQPDQTAAAMVHYEAARRLSPATAGVHNNLANALLRFPERRAEALQEFRTALRLDPSLPHVHFHLANALAEDPAAAEEAEKEFRETLRLSPDHGLCHYNYALLIARQPQRRPETIAHYEAAIRLLPDYVPARFNLGLTFSRDPAQRAAAIAQFKKILVLEPDNTRAQRMLAQLESATEGQ